MKYVIGTRLEKITRCTNQFVFQWIFVWITLQLCSLVNLFIVLSRFCFCTFTNLFKILANRFFFYYFFLRETTVRKKSCIKKFETLKSVMGKLRFQCQDKALSQFSFWSFIIQSNICYSYLSKFHLLPPFKSKNPLQYCFVKLLITKITIQWNFFPHKSEMSSNFSCRSI